MRKVTSILWVEKRVDKKDRPYIITHVQIETGDEVYEYYGDDVKVGDLVQVMHDRKWDKLKVRKPPIDN